MTRPHQPFRINKLLVANRGEIARRVMRTARSMGLRTVAVFSDADENAPHVADADEAIRIGGAAAADSYLRVDRILEAARQSGADAIHPGYGFLAENAEFAKACEEAEICFVGPQSEVIRDLGSKQRSKEIVAAAGVPVIPGYSGTDQSDERLRQAAIETGFPVLIKASAGGGGKGMRIVRDEADLDASIQSARREATSSFGDATLLIERYVDRPRHIEVQIFGDAAGNVVHVFERECSIQRRHQKIVEESPSTALTPELRARICDAAVKVGRAVGYRNAGTVEFILAPDKGGEFFFLEVNTRLQVEHPVTECITGLDLVREQLRVAQGQPLSFTQDELTATGAALECRLYAEDTQNDFLPTTGFIHEFAFDAAKGLRVDTGIESGSEVGIHYDPMLAKIITWGADRNTAVRYMDRALSALRVHGVTTNREFLLSVLRSDEFLAGETDTHFIERNSKELQPDERSAATERLVHKAATAAALSEYEKICRARTVLPHLRSGFRNSRSAREWVEFAVAAAGSDEACLRVDWEPVSPRGYALRVGESELEVARLEETPSGVALEADGHLERFWLTQADSKFFVQSLDGLVTLEEAPRFPIAEADVDPGACIAPMPGKVVSVSVEVGQAVAEGAALVVLEAMKMEHTVRAAQAGTVQALNVTLGQQVEGEDVLVVVAGLDDDS